MAALEYKKMFYYVDNYLWLSAHLLVTWLAFSQWDQSNIFDDDYKTNWTHSTGLGWRVVVVVSD